jgi:hypothetical protein
MLLSWTLWTELVSSVPVETLFPCCRTIEMEFQKHCLEKFMTSDSVQSYSVYGKTRLSEAFKLNFESSLPPFKFRILQSLREIQNLLAHICSFIYSFLAVTNVIFINLIRQAFIHNVCIHILPAKHSPNIKFASDKILL